MARPIKRVYDEDGTFLDREMNDIEYAQWQKDVAALEAETKARQEVEVKKAAAEAKLAALGLDADDLKALGLG
jgi:CRISPR/Cas system-associated protein Cas10 (large subunit of type III CRISPR-Cas system)